MDGTWCEILRDEKIAQAVDARRERGVKMGLKLHSADEGCTACCYDVHDVEGATIQERGKELYLLQITNGHFPKSPCSNVQHKP